MCGIVGIVNTGKVFTAEELKKLTMQMRDMMVHRGPDDFGVWIDPQANCALGHRRLSIIDLRPEGRQPMLNEDGSLGITFNGEIYNYSGLRKNLMAQGHRFSSQTDTEVIVHLMEEEFNGKGVSELEGMFGFAAWDYKKQSLLLARDHFGKKPLYYADGPGWFAFSSELTPLKILPGINLEISRDNVAKYLILQYFPAPDTVFSGIKKLPPGSILKLEYGNDFTIERYAKFDLFSGDPALGLPSPVWNQPTPRGSRISAVLKNKFVNFLARPHNEYPADLDPRRIRELRRLLIEATERRLMSDVPLGAFLSGGVDSSLVVALMAKELDLKPKTFTIGFAGTDETEHEYARMVANHLGTEHYEKVISPDALEMVGMVASALDEPNGDSSCLPTMLLSGFAKEYVTVALSGDGGDEMFGGYGRYFQTLDEEQTALLKGVAPWSPSRAYMSFRIFVLIPEIVESLMGEIPEGAKRYLSSWKHHLDQPGVPLMHRMRALDAATYMPGAVLAKVDRMSMQHSLEVRSPLLDKQVAEFAQTLTPEECYSAGSGKRLLKAVAAKYLPMDWLERKKMGFGLPMTFWKPKELVGFTRDVLLAPNSIALDWMERKNIERYLKIQEDPSCCSVYQIWTLLILALWVKEKAKPC